MARRHDRVAEAWGPGEIAAALEVDASTVARWRRQEGFPAPRWNLSIGPVWDADEVREWRREDIAARRRARAF